MLVTAIRPASGLTEETTQYRPAKDIEAFNALLPPPIEFVEGSSTGTFLMDESKYQPINAAPNSSAAEPAESRKTASSTPAKSPKSPKTSPALGKSLYSGPIDLSWPSGSSIGIGLQNTGNTCFLNSALQCLLHTPPLLHVLLRHGHEDHCRVPKGAFCMSCNLRTTMMESQRKQRPFAPYPITTKLQVIAKHMKRGRQEDSHEFLRYAIDALQKSCLAGYPPKMDSKVAETSWVHRIFGGHLRSRVTCLECGHNSDTIDSALDLSIDIYGLHSVKGALQKFVAVDHLRGADKYKCEKCNKLVTANKQFTVHDAPRVLSIHLKRFSPLGRKIGHCIKYEEHLSLQPFMSEGQHGPTYSLYGVICHVGGGPNSGHYYAHIRSPSGLWYEMNDESVTRCSPPTGRQNAYILFYIRDKGQALEAAVSTPARLAQPAKTGLVANMKKRKSPDSESEDSGRPVKAKEQAAFIGPLLPSSPATPSTPDKLDPQAQMLQKKIGKVTKQASKNGLSELAQYSDSSDDVGVKVEPRGEVSTEKSVTEPETAATPLLPSPTISTPTKKQALLSAIPASSFYGIPSKKAKGSAKKRSSVDSVENDGDESDPQTKNSSVDEGKAKKRKASDDDEDDHDDDAAASQKLKDWARTPIPTTPAKKASTPKRVVDKRFANPGWNPYSRVKNSDNLTGRAGVLQQYGKKKKRLIM